MTTNSASRQLYYPFEMTGEENLRFVGHFYPASNDRQRILQVLIHGNSYDHRYWNAPAMNGQDYSYVDYMAAQGFDLLAIDLPGVGDSDKPDGHAVTLEAVSSAISSMVASLKKKDAIPGYSFDHIAVVGHSMGAAMAVHSEARAPAADSLIVTATGFFPGRPRSAWAPGVREALLADAYAVVPKEGRLKFYHQPQADPEVISYDNSTMRSSIPSGLWSDCISLQDDPEAGFADITCPVFIQLGEHDPILPARYAEEERTLYRSSSEVTVDAIQDIGHSFNLHLNREQSWAGIRDFLVWRTA